MPQTIGAVLPDEPRIVRFFDTIWADRNGSHDDLDTAAKADLALTELGFEHATVTDAEAVRLRQLRDALRRLAAHCTSDDRQRAESPIPLENAATIVNRHASRPVAGPSIMVTGDAALDLAPDGPPTVPELLGQLAREGIDVVTGTVRLRACLAPSCVLYYVQDHPRRGWCSAACGNRARAARHYARTKGETPSPR